MNKSVKEKTYPKVDSQILKDLKPVKVFAKRLEEKFTVSFSMKLKSIRNKSQDKKDKTSEQGKGSVIK